jgi:hypothetical protein
MCILDGKYRSKVLLYSAINIDYFDDLDQEAMDAFGEMNGEAASFNTTSAPNFSLKIRKILKTNEIKAKISYDHKPLMSWR